MFFHSPAAANKVTGLHLTTIKTILERGGNPTYHRKSDNKLFEIRKEDPIKILEIEGEDFFSLEEIQAKFGLSPTKFLNQVKNDKFAKKIDWISPELFSGSEASNESETEKIDERSEAELALEILREEMRSQFEKYQAEMSNLHAEISRLSAKVASLEASLEASLASRPAEVSPPAQEKIFKSKTVFPLDSFNINSIARFIRKGIVGKIQSSGPKTHRYVLIDGRKEYLPDLVEQIIRDHIVPVMENETQEEKTRRLNKYMESKGKIDGLTIGELAALRRGLSTLDPMVIVDISKELMKLI